MNTQSTSVTKVAIVDDHIVLRNALASLIDTFDNCEVVILAKNGAEFIEKLSEHKCDVVILDLDMPVMDGFETAVFLNKKFPEIHVLIFTMFSSDITLIRLLQSGISGFLKKSVDQFELKQAIKSVMEHGYYYSTPTTALLTNLFRKNITQNCRLQNCILTEHEYRFLKLVCTDLTYKEIASELRLSARAVDAIRDSLFSKLEVKSRVGLAMLAVRKGFVSLQN